MCIGKLVCVARPQVSVIAQLRAYRSVNRHVIAADGITLASTFIAIIIIKLADH
jgi:hypothetical protein